MKYLQLIVLLTIAAASTAVTQAESKVAPSQRSVERQLIELERQLSEALVKEDAAVLDRLWSNDLVFTFPNGKMSNKAQRLAGQKPSAESSQSTNVNDQVKVHVYGNTAVVTVLSTWKGSAGAQEYSDQYQATHAWVKQQGRWQLVAAHVSQVKK
ncbi:MAG TPA: nuclear transport factor 2 family protein [Pyrinomonadaceae bacterium]|nr:nuclear transport factor 2 family protein [Pyrinomonadaceae bacterium]